MPGRIFLVLLISLIGIVSVAYFTRSVCFHANNKYILTAMSSRRDLSGNVMPTIASSSISIESILDKFKEDKLEKTIDQSTIVVIRQQLLIWYRVNGRKLPWRGNFQFEDNFQYDFPNPYGTWVSEIMLQQTQVATVIPYWIKWMKVYPTVVALSQATPDEVNKLWAGLGYYRRAQMLLKGSLTVVNKYDGMLPQTVTELKEIEGIGPYTAGAIASIAFNQVSPIVDGNIIRIVSRLLALKCVVGSREMDKLCWQIASDLVDPDNPGDFNQALMDLGATVCRPVSPVCDKCPISSFCLAKKIVDNSSSSDGFRNASKKRTNESSGVTEIEECGLPLSLSFFPRKAVKKASPEFNIVVKVFYTSLKNDSNFKVSSSQQNERNINETYRLLLVKRKAIGLLANQWEFPNQEVIESSVDNSENDVNISFLKFLAEFGIFWQQNTTLPSQLTAYQSIMKSFADGNEIPDININSLKSPIVHVFSHQKHIMSVDVHHVQLENKTINYDLIEDRKFREYRWMTASELAEVGITTGCKKVLKYFQDFMKQKIKNNDVFKFNKDNSILPKQKIKKSKYK